MNDSPASGYVADMHNSFSPRDFILGIVVGFLIAVALISIGTFAFLRTSDIYSLGHWKLNLRTPLRSMWMNLGFWSDHLRIITALILYTVQDPHTD